MTQEQLDKRPIASLSLDLDNKWSYLRTHGDPTWESYPSYLQLVVPIILSFLKQRELTITFFVVGRDVRQEPHHQLFRDISNAGHEIGNHSYNHLPWLHLLSKQELEHEIKATHDVVGEICSVEMCGFRGPGFSISRQHLSTLTEQRYVYDASTFPNVLNPLARAYFFSRSKLSEEEKEQRKALFGTYRDALRPLKPFRWDLGDQSLLEIPVTTMPILRIPIHFSYLIYLASYSNWMARSYFRIAIRLCRMTRTAPSLLLHPLDFLGKEDEPDLGFFPGMSVGRTEKLDILCDCLAELEKHYKIVTMSGHADAVSDAQRDTKLLVPSGVLDH